VKNLDFPAYPVLGNHDVFGVNPKSLVSSDHPEYGKRMFASRIGGGKTYRSFDFRDWHFVLLDSIQVTAALSYEGGIDEEQFDWLKKDLYSVGVERPVVLVTHIPFFSILPTFQIGSTEPVPASIVVKNAKEILEFSSRFNVRLILQGHVHIVEEHGYKNQEIITSGAVCGNWWKGPRMGHPEGFAVYTIDGGRIHWTYRSYGWKVEES
jgi:3',5'-cyclic AMP phosphodiesterase CpdA